MKKYILLVAVAITLASCNSEDNYVEEPVAAQISATIGESTPTRAGDITWNKGDNIGVTMSGRYTNIKYTTANGDGNFTGTTMYFKNKQEPVTLSAYYPYSGTEGQAPAIIEATTGSERQTVDEQPKFDFLYAVKENATGSDPKVNFTFNHRMSKLTLTFKDGNEGTHVSMITSCQIDGLVTEGTFNPVSGVCSAKSTAPSPLNLTPTVVHGVPLPSLILFPQTVSKVTLKITDSQNQEYSCELKFDGNRLDSGNNYVYTINVKKTGLNIENHSIANWSDKTEEYDAKSE